MGTVLAKSKYQHLQQGPLNTMTSQTKFRLPGSHRSHDYCQLDSSIQIIFVKPVAVTHILYML